MDSGGSIAVTGADLNTSSQVTGLHLATTRTGDIIYNNAGTWSVLAGNNSGTGYLSENSSGVPSFVAGTGAALSAVTAASASATINNLNFPVAWNWQQTSAAQTGFAIGENSAAANGAGR